MYLILVAVKDPFYFICFKKLIWKPDFCKCILAAVKDLFYFICFKKLIWKPDFYVFDPSCCKGSYWKTWFFKCILVAVNDLHFKEAYLKTYPNFVYILFECICKLWFFCICCYVFFRVSIKLYHIILLFIETHLKSYVTWKSNQLKKDVTAVHKSCKFRPKRPVGCWENIFHISLHWSYPRYLPRNKKSFLSLRSVARYFWKIWGQSVFL